MRAAAALGERRAGAHPGRAGVGLPRRSTGGRRRSFMRSATRCRPDAVATADSGAHRILFSQIWRCAAPRGLAAVERPLHDGLRGAAGDRPARWDRAAPVLAVVGDAGLEMGLGELATLRDLGLPVIVVVLVDGSLALIEMKQRASGRAERGVGIGDQRPAGRGPRAGRPRRLDRRHRRPAPRDRGGAGARAASRCSPAGSAREPTKEHSEMRRRARTQRTSSMTRPDDFCGCPVTLPPGTGRRGLGRHGARLPRARRAHAGASGRNAAARARLRPRSCGEGIVLPPARPRRTGRDRARRTGGGAGRRRPRRADAARDSGYVAALADWLAGRPSGRGRRGSTAGSSPRRATRWR